jgi:hypothetical protein
MKGEQMFKFIFIIIKFYNFYLSFNNLLTLTHIHVISWIRIRRKGYIWIRINSMRIRNTGFVFATLQSANEANKFR